MKKLIIILLVIVLAMTLFACKEEETDTPETPIISDGGGSGEGSGGGEGGGSGEGSGDVDPEETGASFTASGNAITAGELKLDFGDNAVADGGAVLTELLSDDDETENGLATTLYTLEVDSGCSSPVTVSLPVPEDLSDGDVLLLGIGLNYTLNTSGETQRTYSHYEASVSDGTASATFIPSDFAGDNFYLGADEGGTANSGKKLKLYFGYFTDGCYYENDAHFKLWYPSAYKMSAELKAQILDDLEDMYDGIGYDLGTGCMDVQIKRNIKESGYYQQLDNTITMNANLFDNGYQPTTKPVLYHEYFHYVQDVYDDTVFGNLWFAEATASYYEAKINNSTFTGLTSECFESQFESVIPKKSTAKAGYARAPLIAYVSSQTGSDEWIKELYVSGVTDSDISAVFSGISVLFEEEYHYALATGAVGQFPAYTFHSILAGGTYGSSVGGKMTLTMPNSATLANAEESGDTPITLGSVSYAMYGTGCREVAIVMTADDLSGLPSTAKVFYTENDDCTVRLIRSKGKTCETVSSAMTVADLKTSLSDGYRYTLVISALGERTQEKSAEVAFTVTPLLNTEYAQKEISYSGTFARTDHIGQANLKVTITLTSDRGFKVTYTNQGNNSQKTNYNIKFNGISVNNPVNLTVTVKIDGTVNGSTSPFIVELKSHAAQYAAINSYVAETLSDNSGTTTLTDTLKYTKPKGDLNYYFRDSIYTEWQSDCAVSFFFKGE